MKPIQILLSLAFALLFLCSPAFAQTGQITGTVTEEATNAPVPGVNVVIAGTQRGASTDANGAYTIQGVEPGTYTLRASYVGYGEETREGVNVVAGETTTVVIALQRAQVGLDELVVVGYGEQQRRDLTGSVSSVSVEEIEEASPTSVEQALQGRVAGAQVTQTSSRPGGGTSIRIRGTGSIQSGAEPLYVVDGVPLSSSSLPGPGTASVSPLATINPQDIASIEILKDASATAIYGARGSNGVVLVTTKQGRSGDTRVNFSSYVGASHVINTYELASASQLATFLNEAAGQLGADPYFSDPEALSSTDWQDLVYKNSAMTQNYQLSVRGGGNDVTNVALSGNFYENQGIVEGSGFRRYSFRANADRDVSDRFRIGSNVSVSRSLYDQIPSEGVSGRGGVVGGAMLFPSFIPPFDEDGNYTTSGYRPQGVSSQLGIASTDNPLAQVREQTDETRVNRVLGDVHAEFDISEGLSVRTRFGADIEDVGREFYATRLIPETNTRGSATNQDIQRRNFVSENVLQYNDTFADVHDVDVTAGFTWQREANEFQFVGNSQFVTDITRNDDIGAGNQEGGPDVGSSASEWTLLSYLGRVNYTFDSKYLFTLTGRYDGSSKFGAGNKWGFFPSGAVAWRIIEEPFMQERDAFSDLKLRASYGWSGNQEIGTYSSLAQLNTVETSFLGQVAAGFVPSSLGNPELKWETSRQLDVGLDVGVFDQRLRATFDYYRKTTEDLILPVTLPLETGFNSVLRNTGSIFNTGFEASLGADIFVGSDGGFTWSTAFNAATNRNKVLDLGESGEFFGPGLEAELGVFRSQGSLVREGEPIGMFFGWETDGIFNDQAEIDAHGAQPTAQPGDIKLVDTDGDGEITSEDRTILGDPNPDVTFGWTNRFSYGGVSLSVFLQGALGGDVYNIGLLRIETFNNTNFVNQTVRRIEGRWTPENRDAEFPRAGYDAPGPAVRPSRYVQDASYVRLKNVTLGYTFPMERLGISGVRNARLYVQGRDLYTFTDYVGYSPDVSSKGQRLINQGYDLNAYPFTRTYTVGIDLTF